jgi:hypothetical protein
MNVWEILIEIGCGICLILIIRQYLKDFVEKGTGCQK